MIGDLVEAFQKLFDPRYQGIVGARFQRIMRNVLASLSEVRGELASLLDVPRVHERRDTLSVSLSVSRSSPDWR